MRFFFIYNMRLIFFEDFIKWLFMKKHQKHENIKNEPVKDNIKCYKCQFSAINTTSGAFLPSCIKLPTFNWDELNKKNKKKREREEDPHVTAGHKSLRVLLCTTLIIKLPGSSDSAPSGFRDARRTWFLGLDLLQNLDQNHDNSQVCILSCATNAPRHLIKFQRKTK